MSNKAVLLAGMLAAVMSTHADAQVAPGPNTSSQVAGFSYAMISVTDLEKSKHFYMDLLGLKIAYDHIHDSPLGIGLNKTGSQTSGEFSLLVQQAPGGAKAGPIAPPSQYSGPIGIWVTGIENYLARAKAAGVTVVRGLNDPGGAGPRTIVLRDPDGLIVELLEARAR